MSAKSVEISTKTAALIEGFRDNLFQSEDDIIGAALERLRETETREGRIEPFETAAGKTGCDLGMGVVLAEGEKLYLFRYKASLGSLEPDGTATARGGRLYVEGEEVAPSKGSLVQPALRLLHRRRRIGGAPAIPHKAWEQWHVHRDGRFVPVADLRTPESISRRDRDPGIDLDLE